MLAGLEKRLIKADGPDSILVVGGRRIDITADVLVPLQALGLAGERWNTVAHLEESLALSGKELSECR